MHQRNEFRADFYQHRDKKCPGDNQRRHRREDNREMPKRDSNFNPIGTSRGIKSRSGGITDWETVDRDKLIRVIATASDAGGAIRFGYTWDGGAYAIGIYGDGPAYTVYVKPSEDLNTYLDDINDLFASIRDDKKAGIQPSK
jgi:hypothetical protein